ncbi:hypothetical protein GD416_13150 [Burkholderia sp. BE24]|uniref:DUF6984 family protein n=1 Tax=Burkholderia TaxID=32008 RepID=UPI00117C2E7C|nr:MULTISPECIES: hypothetical protein [Burkholderia]MPV57347.1 hypothetical protein [Burkholderia sp. BE24]
MLNDEWAIRDNEIELIRVLLDHAFPGDTLFSAQIEQMERVVSFNGDDTILKIGFGQSYHAIRKQVIRPNLNGFIEASGIDSDGAVVNVMLWITDGEIKELEFLRPDSKPVQRKPRPSDLSGFQSAI